MTTICANRKSMCADKMISGGATFSSSKLFRIGSSIYGGAGDYEPILIFLRWRADAQQIPDFKPEDNFNILELNQHGLYCWGARLVPMHIEDEFYAIGSGSGFALGALAHGATLQAAVRTASRWDECTGTEVQTFHLKAK
jgi:hypothetical protein